MQIVNRIDNLHDFSRSLGMIPRAAARELVELARYYPVVALTGLRQSGKTTLARAVFVGKPYVSLEDPDIREFALTDPRGFLGQFPDGAVLNEAQRAPQLFSYLLPPYFRNFRKRLTKIPKLYFLDVGFAAWLMGIRDAATLQTNAFRGVLFETWVVSEFIKRKRHRLHDEELYFWPDSSGNEIDLLVARGEQVVAAVECKSGLTIAEDWLKPLSRFQALAGRSSTHLVFGGDRGQSRTSAKLHVWRQIDRLLDECFGGVA